MLSLELLYYPGNKSRPLRIATIADRALLANAAHAAITEAEVVAHDLQAVDDVLASIQYAEVGRLRRVLDLLMEEPLRNAVSTAVM